MVFDLVIDFSFDSNTVGFPIFPCFACAGLSELVVRTLHEQLCGSSLGSKTLERQKSLETRGRSFAKKERWSLCKKGMSKGGARHFAKPTLDPGLVQKALKNNSEIIKDFGVYEHISTTGAVNPAGLLYCRMFLEDVLEISPTCMIASQPLRTALLGMLEKEPQLNCSKFNGSTWCSMKAERITVVLTHLRKVAREPSCKRVCASKLSGFESQQLLHPVSQVDIQDEQPKTGGKCLNRKATEASLLVSQRCFALHQSWASIEEQEP